jgi:CheY-like chemotaxis protein
LLCGACGHASAASAFHGKAQPSEEEAEPTNTLAEALRPRVVVGHEVPAAAVSAARALRAHGYAPVCVRSGEMALAACDPAMPSPAAALVLDVAIPGVLAFQVVEQLRARPETKRLPIVLLASVFERTRYKRRPTNLYGADAYLELHHVPDKLGPAIDILRRSGELPPDRLQAPVERARAASLRTVPPVGDQEAAEQLARRLLSDVALYHGDELADGVRRGRPFSSLGSAVDAARDLFRQSCDRADVFESELERFSERLLERGGPRAAHG